MLPSFEVTRAKLRAAKLGKKQSESQRQNRSLSLQKYYSDPANRALLGQKHLGFTHTKETRKKMSESRYALNVRWAVEYVRLQLVIMLLCRGVSVD